MSTIKSAARRRAFRQFLLDHIRQNTAITVPLDDETTITLDTCLKSNPLKLSKSAIHHAQWQDTTPSIVKLFYAPNTRQFETMVSNELAGYALAKPAGLSIPKMLTHGPLKQHAAYFVVYEKLPHRPFNFRRSESWQALVAAQQQLFAADVVQYDNHSSNYLLTPNGIAFIDFSTLRRKPSPRHCFASQRLEYIASIHLLGQAFRHLPNSSICRVRTCRLYFDEVFGASYNQAKPLRIALWHIAWLEKLRTLANNNCQSNTRLIRWKKIGLRYLHTMMSQVFFVLWRCRYRKSCPKR